MKRMFPLHRGGPGQRVPQESEAEPAIQAGDQDGADGADGARLGRRGEAAVDAAQDDDDQQEERHDVEQRPAGLARRGAGLGFGRRSRFTSARVMMKPM